MTALVDLYPRVLRKKNRREVLILGVSVISFLVGLVMVTEVRLWEAGRWGERAKRWSHGGQLPPVRGSRLLWFQGPGPLLSQPQKHHEGKSPLWPLGIDRLLTGMGEG